ncbi:MAG: hypothetical protein ACLSU0_08355 [Oscillospiraceae bacterium]
MPQLSAIIGTLCGVNAAYELNKVLSKAAWRRKEFSRRQAAFFFVISTGTKRVQWRNPETAILKNRDFSARCRSVEMTGTGTPFGGVGHRSLCFANKTTKNFPFLQSLYCIYI